MPWQDKKTPVYTSVNVFVCCVCVHICMQMKPCLWSFCMESMKQAWQLNRVFIHFGLWHWDQRNVKNYKQTRGDLLVHTHVCMYVSIDWNAKNQVKEREREESSHVFVCLVVCAVYVCVASQHPLASILPFSIQKAKTFRNQKDWRTSTLPGSRLSIRPSSINSIKQSRI